MQAKLYYLLLCIVCFGLPLHAQLLCPDSVIKLAKADQQANSYYSTIINLEKTTENYPNCIETFSQLANLYLQTNQYTKAKNSVYKCINIDSKKGTEILHTIGEQLILTGNTTVYEQLIAGAKQKTSLPPTYRKLVDSDYYYYKQHIRLKNTIINCNPINIGFIINDNAMQLSPTLSADATQLIYTSTVNKLNEDFMLSTYDTCTGWSTGVNLGYPPNTSYPERSGKLSSDGHYLFYTRCDNRSVNGWDGGGCDVTFSSRINDSTWGSPQQFGATINSPDYEADPCISSDNKTMYFVSDRAGGYGGKDIWRSKHERGLWQKPTNLGPNVNTTGNETAPFIHADNASLYFVSDGHIGLGGNDFYIARLIKDSVKQKAINLGAPINNKGNQHSITVSTNGQFALFAADTISRKNSSNFDIYQTQLPNSIQPIASHFIIGNLINKKTKKHLPDTKIYVLDSNKKEKKFIRSNAGDASFCIPILHQQQLYLHVDSTDEFAAYDRLIDASKTDLPAILNYNIAVKPYKEKDTIYAASFDSELIKDTSLAYCKNNITTWQILPKDSIMYVATIYQNKYIDTTFATTVCFSDSGYMQYQTYIDSIAANKQIQFDNYFIWYKKYLQQCGFTSQQIIFDYKQNYVSSKKLFTIDINIIEYYP